MWKIQTKTKGNLVKSSFSAAISTNCETNLDLHSAVRKLCHWIWTVISIHTCDFNISSAIHFSSKIFCNALVNSFIHANWVLNWECPVIKFLTSDLDTMRPSNWPPILLKGNRWIWYPKYTTFKFTIVVEMENLILQWFKECWGI